MGTRADFYVGRLVGRRLTDAQWLGSISWDGDPASRNWPGVPHPLLNRRAERTWREAVAKFLASQEDSTVPEQGWPWPWKTSHLTDWCYVFDLDTQRVHCFNYATYIGSFQKYRAYLKTYDAWRAQRDRAEARGDEALERFFEKHGHGPDPEKGPKFKFPDMSQIQNVTLGPRSGVMVVGLSEW